MFAGFPFLAHIDLGCMIIANQHHRQAGCTVAPGDPIGDTVANLFA